MANKNAMVVGIGRKRAKLCVVCDRSCEHACPMRLKPRILKRNMFTCTQCVQACENVQQNNSNFSLLKMLDEHCAHDVSDRGFGRKPDVPAGCFNIENQAIVFSQSTHKLSDYESTQSFLILRCS